MLRDPLPIESAARSVPLNDRLWLHKDQCTLPSRPELAEQYPEHLILDMESRLRMTLTQNLELLAEGEILQKQVITRGQGTGEESEEKSQHRGHAAVLAVKSPCKSGRMEFWRGTGRFYGNGPITGYTKINLMESFKFAIDQLSFDNCETG